MVKISVIISVFNEKTLRKCLDSVINQTFEEIEIICVIDEAVPNILRISKEYTNKDNRIIIVSHITMSIYETKNIGIEYATGEYILFVNSTDWLELDCLEKLYNNATSNNSDLVLYNFIEHKNNETREIIYLDNKNNIDFNHYSFNHYYNKRLLLNNIFFSNSKFYNASFLKSKSIKYNFADIFDEIQFHIEVMVNTKKISYLPKTLYHFNKNDWESLKNHNLNFNKHLMIFYSLNDMRNILLTKGIFKDFKLEFIEFELEYINKYYSQLPADLKEEFYNNMRNEFVNWKLNSDLVKKIPYELYRFYSLVLAFESYKNFKNFINNINTQLKFIDKQKISKEIEKFNGNLDDVESSIIVSLTSIPDRIYDIHFTLYSLLNQSLKPEKVILWLAKEQFPRKEKDIPKTVLGLKKNGLVIKWCEDIKSFKKLIPSLREFPDKYIVTADDDLYYPNNWLENIWKQHKKYPNTIISSRSRKIVFDENNEFCEYHQWKLSSHEEKPSYLNFPTNGAGTLFYPNSLSKEVFNQDLFLKICNSSDDIWFWAMMILNKTKISVVETPMNELIYVNVARELNILDQITLWETNKSGKNDSNLNNLLNEFPKIKEIIKNEEN